MRYRQVGNWPLKVSEVAFGTGDNGGGIIYGTPLEQQALVESALELGVNLFDCSPDYGKGLGEANLGRVLRELSVREALVITKVEIMPEEVTAGLIQHKVKQSVDDSLLRLQRDHVDVIMLHNPIRKVRDPEVRVWMRLAPEDVFNEVLPALQKVRASGKARFLGLACEASEAAAVRPLLATREFTMINAWYNLANPTAAKRIDGFLPEEDYSGLFDAAAEFGAGVAVIRPLAGGALTDAILARGTDARHSLSRGFYRERPQELAPEIERARRLAFLAKPSERTLSEAAYRYVLSNPVVCTIIGGFSEVAHLKEAARASDAGPLDAADMAAINKVHAADFSGRLQRVG